MSRPKSSAWPLCSHQSLAHRLDRGPGKKMTNDDSSIRDGDDATRHVHHEAPPVPASKPAEGGHSAHGHDHHTSRAAHADQEAHTGHDRHAGHSAEMFRRKFWGTLLLSIPTIVWAPMIQHWFGYQALGAPGTSRWISATFWTLVFAYGGWVFIKGAISELAERLPGMMTLIALAISVAFGFSLAVTFGFPGTDLWSELAALITIMLL